jgi:hypothetical protein
LPPVRPTAIRQPALSGTREAQFLEHLQAATLQARHTPAYIPDRCPTEPAKHGRPALRSVQTSYVLVLSKPTTTPPPPPPHTPNALHNNATTNLMPRELPASGLYSRVSFRSCGTMPDRSRFPIADMLINSCRHKILVFFTRCGTCTLHHHLSPPSGLRCETGPCCSP